MSVSSRNNVHISGKGQITIIFAHGFGCDQSMWRYIMPEFEDKFTVVVYDLVGSGSSDLSHYDYEKYASLDGYASDLLEIIDEVSDKPVVFVGHSASAMAGMLAAIRCPEKFLCQIMVGASPCYVNDGDYIGGFSKADVLELCDTIDSNYLAWSSNMAPVIMGAFDQPELGVELTNSFCRADPDIAKHFARVAFTSDHRDALSKLSTPSLILHSSDDFIAPLTVGMYMQTQIPDAQLCIIENTGHCLQLSEPDASTRAIKNFLTKTLKC